MYKLVLIRDGSKHDWAGGRQEVIKHTEMPLSSMFMVSRFLLRALAHCMMRTTIMLTVIYYGIQYRQLNGR